MEGTVLAKKEVSEESADEVDEDGSLEKEIGVNENYTTAMEVDSILGKPKIEEEGSRKRKREDADSNGGTNKRCHSRHTPLYKDRRYVDAAIVLVYSTKEEKTIETHSVGLPLSIEAVEAARKLKKEGKTIGDYFAQLGKDENEKEKEKEKENGKEVGGTRGMKGLVNSKDPHKYLTHGMASVSFIYLSISILVFLPSSF